MHSNNIIVGSWGGRSFTRKQRHRKTKSFFCFLLPMIRTAVRSLPLAYPPSVYYYYYYSSLRRGRHFSDDESRWLAKGFFLPTTVTVVRTLSRMPTLLHTVVSRLHTYPDRTHRYSQSNSVPFSTGCNNKSMPSWGVSVRG